MADESIIVKQQGTIFLGGPPLVSICFCKIAGNVSSTAHALIGHFEVTWHLPIKLVPAKSLWASNITKIYEIRGKQGNCSLLFHPVFCPAFPHYGAWFQASKIVIRECWSSVRIIFMILHTLISFSSWSLIRLGKTLSFPSVFQDNINTFYF